MDCGNDEFCNTLKGYGLEGMFVVVFKGGRVFILRICLSLGLQMLVLWVALFGGGVQLVRADQQAGTVRQIHVTGDDRDLGVEITASKPVIPRTQTVSGPDRLIVDLPETRPDVGLRNIEINRGKLRDVRVALLSANPPTTRVVLDLVAPIEYGVSPLANRIIVKLGKASGIGSASIVPISAGSAEVKTTEVTAALPGVRIEQPSERSWARWIMPILVMTTVLAMLVIALVLRIQNGRGRRGL